VTVKKHILIVDDDPAIRRMVGEFLDQYDYGVYLAENGREMSRYVDERSVDLVVLDMKLAAEDGLTLIRELRLRSHVPIIALTGTRREEADRIMGLEFGADDYVLKPFSPRELLARIRAVLRRAELSHSLQNEHEKRTRYRFDGWELNMRTHRLTSPRGDSVELSRGEFALLTAFLRSPQQILSREQLLAATRMHEDVFDRSVDAQILRLRRKLETDPSNPHLIRTERGAGYMFAAAVQIS
jgi:DNA-binding response OmpR family regulator